MRRDGLRGLIVAALVYLGLQVYVMVTPPVILTGYGTIQARPGDKVVLSVMFRNAYRVPFRLTGVSIDPHAFALHRACVVNHATGRNFTGSPQATLPPEFAERCKPIGAVDQTWTSEYAIAMQGQVLHHTDEGAQVTLSYRVLGWPHHVSFPRQLFEP